MRTLAGVFAVLLVAGATGAIAQNQPRGQQPPPQPPAGPYRAVSITPPQPLNDSAITALLKQLGEAAQRKDRAALAKLVVGQGFFWFVRTAIAPTSASPALTTWRRLLA